MCRTVTGSTGISWAPGSRPLICVGVNPSTAAPGALDNTLKSAERIALFNGYDSFIMFNVYAQRATRPEDMDRELNPRLHAENLKAFRYVLSQSEGAPSVWAAWGAIIEKRPYLPRCVLDMVRRRPGVRRPLVHRRPAQQGRPSAPSPLSPEGCAPLEPFDDLEAYLQGLSQALAEK